MGLRKPRGGYQIDAAPTAENPQGSNFFIQNDSIPKEGVSKKRQKRWQLLRLTQKEVKGMISRGSVPS